VGTRGHSPYRAVATNGWTLDPQGKATSKSLGNGIDPVEIAKKLGAEIIRLWVASVDFQEDVTVSEDLLKRVSVNYVDLRNRFKNILSNLPDFDPAKDAVNFDDMLPLDQYMLLRTAEISQQIQKWYESFEFHRIYHQVNEFFSAELSNMYFAAIKDRLYTAAPAWRSRRSAQTAIWRIAEAMVRLVAPLMSFTADEIWQSLPNVGGRAESVHMAYFPKPEEITGLVGKADLKAIHADFDVLLAVREEILKALEIARQEKVIGRSEDAAVTIHAPEATAKLLERYREHLRFLMVVSEIEVISSTSGNGNAPLHVLAQKAPGGKCERCWFYSTHVGESERYPTACERCLKALEEIESALPV
jgi:isoleucyl-tRNA synthetase